MLLAKSLRIWFRVGLVFLMVGCTPVSGTPIPEAATPSSSPPTPTLPAQNTATVEAADQLILGQLLADNGSGVEGLAFSPDGQTLASIHQNGEIILWDLATRQNIQSFMGGGETGGFGMLTGLTFSPDGKSLVSKVNGPTITIWEVATGQSIDVVSNLGHGDGMALSPDGKLLAYGQCAKLDSRSHCGQYEIILWEVATRQTVGQPPRFEVAAPAPLWLLFSPDSKTLAVMSSGTTGSGKIELFDVVTRQPIVSPLGGEVPFSSMAFSPDGKFMALGSFPGVIYLWDVKSHQVFSQLIGEKGLVTGLIFSPNGKTLAARILIPATDPKEKIVLWEMDTLQTIGQPLTGQTRTGSAVGLISLAFSPDGRVLASGTDTGLILLWNLATSSPHP